LSRQSGLDAGRPGVLLDHLVPGPRQDGPVHETTAAIAVREPFAAEALLGFLAVHAVPGVETVAGGVYARTMRLPHGPGVARVQLVDRAPGIVPCRLALCDSRDVRVALRRLRRLLDADRDPTEVDDALGVDPVLGPLVAANPGLRVPGSVDGFEVGVRTILGQQVTVSGGITLTARLVTSYGESLAGGDGLTHLFPTPAELAGIDIETLAMPRARGRALTRLASAVASGQVALDGSRPRDEVRAGLLALPGIGPWTADYLAMRALGEPDAFLPTDVGVRRASTRLGVSLEEVLRASEHWRPWRSYALMHLWQVLFTPALP
jgi:AraC family transcriptional regulator of adaptative response / DNA-3-methyladenine glycosylase II